MGISTSPTPSRPPHGFTQTDVGLAPQDWDVSTVGAEFSVQLGKMIDAAKNVGVSKPYIGNRAVQWGRVDLDAIATVPMSQSDLQRFQLQHGDLLVCEGGEIGRAAIWDDPISECYYQKAIHRLRPTGSYSAALLMSFLQLWTSTGRLANYVTQTSIAHLPKDKFELVPLPAPSTTEQRAIVEALSDVDGLIEALEKLIAKKLAIKQAAMQQLLTGKTRLPGFNGEWETQTLGELEQDRAIRLFRGKVISQKDIDRNPGPYPIYSSSIHANGLFGCYGTYMLDEELITWSVDGGGDFFYRPKHRFSVTNVCGYMRILTPNLSCKFLAYTLQELHRRKIFDYTMKAHPSVIRGEYSVALPTAAEQTTIATVLSDIDAEIAALECRRDKTRQIKQGMLQQLLTGRIRLVKPLASAVQTDAKSKESKPHSWAFNEAVVISTLAKHFGKDAFPLGRKRYTKLSYLLHRHVEKQAEGYLKKAAGPYNPKTKYGGPERIALESGYVREHKHGPYSGFVAAGNITQAESYFEKWYGKDTIQWLEQFRFKKNDDLELLATVDMAVEELHTSGKDVDVPGVKAVIRSHPEWKAKLDREIFSDANIAKAIKASQELFGREGET